MTKIQLPLDGGSTRPSYKKLLAIAGAAIAGSGLLYLLLPTSPDLQSVDYCPGLDKLVPESDDKLSDIEYFHSEEYQKQSLEVWRGAVRIPTQNYDDLGDVGEDARWDVFFNFSSYLAETFTEVTKNARIEKVNTHGLVYTIEGSDKSLKPILLGGHQDVVPVPDETVPRWTYPPFEGYFDGEFLWGRGTSDCKNNVIGFFEALEVLFKRGFKPSRTIILALGFDEETSGLRGAQNINKFLEKKLGDDSIFLIVDEGGLGIQDIHGARFALPSTGEKGYVDYTIDIITVGGHSSVPPRHTSIGIIADLIHEIEKDEYPVDISTKNPFFYQLQCEAKASQSMSASLKNDILHLETDKKAKERVLKDVVKSPERKVLVSTTQAVDIVFGGLKINALPEKVTVKINHRVSYESSLDAVKEKILKAANVISERFNLDIEAFGETVKENAVSSGLIDISSNEPLVAAPVTSIIDNPSWDILGGTIRHVFEDFAEFDDQQNVTVTPSCMTGNTDTRYYWSLTDNIYRFTPIKQNERKNAHAIDERVSLKAHIEGVVFYYELLRNTDSYKGN